MKKDTIDRVENATYWKSKRFFLVLAITSLVIAIINIALTPSLFHRKWEMIDALLLITPIFLFAIYLLRRKIWGNQFVEWTETGFTYKGRERKPHEIHYDSLNDVSIKLDTIEFHMKDGTSRTFMIEDFQEYEDRIRIKENFEKVRENTQNSIQPL